MKGKKYLSIIGIYSKIFIIVIIILFASSRRTKCQTRKDYLDHLMIGTALGFGTSVITINQPAWKSFAWSTGTTLVISGGKELIDIRGKGESEWQDIAYSVAGSMIGWGLAKSIFYISGTNDRKKRYLAFTGNGLIYNF
jgi:hypothetical protein